MSTECMVVWAGTILAAFIGGFGSALMVLHHGMEGQRARSLFGPKEPM